MASSPPPTNSYPVLTMYTGARAITWTGRPHCNNSPQEPYNLTTNLLPDSALPDSA